MTLTFEQARECVLREVRARAIEPGVEQVGALESAGRVLAEAIVADRDYPPFPRSARDGFAVRSADLPGELRVTGEVRAGQSFLTRPLSPGEAVEIMTGAPLPPGADQVVMVEHSSRVGDVVRIERPGKPGDNFNPRGAEAAGGAAMLEPGRRRLLLRICKLWPGLAERAYRMTRG